VEYITVSCHWGDFAVGVALVIIGHLPTVVVFPFFTTLCPSLSPPHSPLFTHLLSFSLAPLFHIHIPLERGGQLSTSKEAKAQLRKPTSLNKREGLVGRFFDEVGSDM